MCSVGSLFIFPHFIVSLFWAWSFSFGINWGLCSRCCFCHVTRSLDSAKCRGSRGSCGEHVVNVVIQQNQCAINSKLVPMHSMDNRGELLRLPPQEDLQMAMLDRAGKTTNEGHPAPIYRTACRLCRKDLSQNGLSQNGLSQNGYGIYIYIYIFYQDLVPATHRTSLYIPFRKELPISQKSKLARMGSPWLNMGR